MKTYEGQLVTSNEKFCIILSRFNDFIGAKLLDGAIDELRRHGVSEDNIDIVRVPGIANVSLQTEIPVIFGVLTTENIEQAIERAGTKAGNKGSEAAKTAIEMANLMKL